MVLVCISILSREPAIRLSESFCFRKEMNIWGSGGQTPHMYQKILSPVLDQGGRQILADVVCMWGSLGLHVGHIGLRVQHLLVDVGLDSSSPHFGAYVGPMRMPECGEILGDVELGPLG